MSKKTRKLGLLTSGGDAPGMNAVIRAVVRTAIERDIKVIGIKRGFEGLLNGEIEELSGDSVSEIIQNGGTILLTARCHEMYSEAGVDRAANICRVLGLDGLVIVGGNGSLQGALALSRKGVNVFGVPGTIDLDVDCTEYTIGFDTAVNSGMEALDKIKDTSTSHERCSVVEVFGGVHSGNIALWCAMSSGAEEVLVPGRERDTDAIIEHIFANRSKGKTHNLIIVSECVGGTAELTREIESVTGIETRATILGYLQRGGSPTALDRLHGSIMGNMAAELFAAGERNRVVVFKNGKHTHIDIEEALSCDKKPDEWLYDIVMTLTM